MGFRIALDQASPGLPAVGAAANDGSGLRPGSSTPPKSRFPGQGGKQLEGIPAGQRRHFGPIAASEFPQAGRVADGSLGETHWKSALGARGGEPDVVPVPGGVLRLRHLRGRHGADTQALARLARTAETNDADGQTPSRAPPAASPRRTVARGGWTWR